MPDKSSQQPQSTETDDRVNVDLGALIQLLQAQNASYASQFEGLTERLVTALAAQLSQRPGSLSQGELEQIRAYGVLRQQLGGPADTGALSVARILSIRPMRGPVGTSVTIHLENAGDPTRVAFTGADGGTVPESPLPGSTAEYVQVKVPPGAVTGAVTVITDRGDPTSMKPFLVSSEREVAPVALELVGFRKEWER